MRGIARAAFLWGGLTLSGVGLLAGFTIWHLVRRGRVLRDSLSNPKAVLLPRMLPEEDP